jgi:hypothetical protein
MGLDLCQAGRCGKADALQVVVPGADRDGAGGEALEGLEGTPECVGKQSY